MGKWLIADSNQETEGVLEFLKSCGIPVPDKVKEILAASPEYQDEPRMDGTIRITRKIAGGTLHHVEHAMRLMLNLTDVGMVLPEGVSLDDLLRTFLYHDVGKQQPDLEPGDIVMPAKVFEVGKLHAARSWALLKDFGEDSRIVEELVRYHHHGAGELPEDLLPEVRDALTVIQLVDGLSAALTRRKVKVHLVWDDRHPSLVGVEEIHSETGRVVYHKVSSSVGSMSWEQGKTLKSPAVGRGASG